MGNSSARRGKRVLNLNLKDGNLIKLGNQGMARQKSFEFDFKGREINEKGNLKGRPP